MENLLLRFFRSFYDSLTYGYLWNSIPYAAIQRQNRKRKHYSGVLAFIRVDLRALLIIGPTTRMRNEPSCKVEILI